MTPIFVSALLLDTHRVLLARDAEHWELPSTPLADGESTEEALARLLGKDLRTQIVDEVFLDSLYERTPNGRPAIRNVFLVRS